MGIYSIRKEYGCIFYREYVPFYPTENQEGLEL